MNPHADIIRKYPSRLWCWAATQAFKASGSTKNGQPWQPTALKFYRKMSIRDIKGHVHFLWDDTNKIESLYFASTYKHLLEHPSIRIKETNTYLSTIEAMADES